MPYTYNHVNVTSSDTNVFSCTLMCEQCGAPSKNGVRCKRRVCIGLPFCWQHTKRTLGLVLKESKAIPGALGLFTDHDIHQGEMVAPYGGEKLSDEEVVQRYGEGPLSLGPYLLYSVDSACKRYIASGSNGAFGLIHPSTANVTFYPTCHRYQGQTKEAGSMFQGRTLNRSNLGIKYWSFASKDIDAGSELIADYGDKHYDETFQRREAKCAELGVTCDETTKRKGPHKTGQYSKTSSLTNR